MTSVKAEAPLYGRMAECTRVTGVRESNMEWVCLLVKIIKLREESGNTEEKLGGLIIIDEEF
jgi:hypothetical protein